MRRRGGKGLILPRGGNHVVFLELRRDSRVTTGISAFPLGWPWVRPRLPPGSVTLTLGWISVKTQNTADPSPGCARLWPRLQHFQMVFFSGYPAIRGSPDFAWRLVLSREHTGLYTPTVSSRGACGAGERPFSKAEKHWQPLPFVCATGPPRKCNEKRTHQGATDSCVPGALCSGTGSPALGLCSP